MNDSNDASRKAYLEAGRALALYILCFNLAKGDSSTEDISTLLRYCRNFAGLSVEGDRTNWRDVAEFWRATHLIYFGGCAAERIKWNITETPSLSEPEFEKAYYAQQWFWVDLDHNPTEEQVFTEALEGLNEAIEKLNSHWQVVEVLAKTLLEKSELSAEETFQIITENIDTKRLAMERLARLGRKTTSVISRHTPIRQVISPEVIQGMDLKVSYFQCCGEENFYPFKCSACGHIMVFCYECDTIYPDLTDTSIMNLHVDRYYCPKCQYEFEEDFVLNPMYQVTPVEWVDAGYEVLLMEPAKWTKLPPRYPCPCCGYVVFREPPGSYLICPICFWEDDLSQLRFVHTTGANHVSLVKGQRNYLSFGAAETRFKDLVRQPLPHERRDPDWRLIDPIIDNIEEPVSGVDYGNTYPTENDALYYWRPSYWRRKKS